MPTQRYDAGAESWMYNEPVELADMDESEGMPTLYEGPPSGEKVANEETSGAVVQDVSGVVQYICGEVEIVRRSGVVEQ